MVEIVAGTGVPADVADYLSQYIDDFLTSRGQDMQAAASRDSAAASRYGADRSAEASMYGADKQYAAALLGFQAEMAGIKAQYAIDAENLGQQAADLNFRQRQAQAGQRLNEKFYGLQHEQARQGVEEFNFGQRLADVQARTGIMGMLADRRGPQDIVAYQNLLSNLNAPNPDRSTTLDPFSILEGLVREMEFNPPAPETAALGESIYQPYSMNLPSSLNIDSAVSNAINQANAQARSTVTAASGGYGGYESSGVGGYYGSGGGATAPAPSGGIGDIGSIDDLDPGLAAMVQDLMSRGATPQNALSSAALSSPYFQDPSGDQAAQKQAARELQGQIFGGLYDWASSGGEGPKPGSSWYQAAEGGMFRGGPHVVEVGDPPKGSNKPNREVVIGSDFTVIPKSKLRGKPTSKAATGGTYGGGGNTITYNQYDDLSGLPAYQAITGGMKMPAFSGFGATLSNPDIGINDAPSMYNLQTYRDITPSGRDNLNSIYEQGLFVDERDILERSRRAAPFGASFGQTRYGAA